MKNLIIRLIGLTSLFVAPCALSQEAEAKIVNVINPPFSNGIQVGDILSRTFEIVTDLGYQIPKSALPIKGENRNGIELKDVTVKSSTSKTKNNYTITLRYQIFTSAAKPVVMQLPEEIFILTSGTKALSIQAPIWGFWFSPLAAEGVTNAKANLQPQYKPTLINLDAHYARLWASLATLMMGLLGLIYINADKRWLPFMNGAFAQAHRQLKKLAKAGFSENEATQKQALIYMHLAFNKIHGENLFSNEVDQFVRAHPAFEKLKAEIKGFFTQSNASLFASQQQNGAEALSALIKLSKRFRDCERGV
jgi:mxaA protein